MPRKAMWVWLSSALTGMAFLHLLEAVSALVFNNQIRLLQWYPIVGERLQGVTPATYFWASAFGTFILWGITCLLAFDNPVETFLNKILSEAELEDAQETQLVEAKAMLLDAMNETVLTNNILLGELKDRILNIRAEVKEVQPLKDMIETMTTELSRLKREVKSLAEIKYLLNVRSLEQPGNQELRAVSITAKT